MTECIVMKIIALLFSGLYFGVGITFAFRMWKSKVKLRKILLYSIGWVFFLVHIILNGDMRFEDSK